MRASNQERRSRKGPAFRPENCTMKLQEVLQKASGRYGKLFRQAKDRVDSDRTAVRLVREVLKDRKVPGMRSSSQGEPDTEETGQGKDDSKLTDRVETETGSDKDTNIKRAARPTGPLSRELTKEAGEPYVTTVKASESEEPGAEPVGMMP